MAATGTIRPASVDWNTARSDAAAGFLLYQVRRREAGRDQPRRRVRPRLAARLPCLLRCSRSAGQDDPTGAAGAVVAAVGLAVRPWALWLRAVARAHPPASAHSTASAASTPGVTVAGGRRTPAAIARRAVNLPPAGRTAVSPA